MNSITSKLQKFLIGRQTVDDSGYKMVFHQKHTLETRKPDFYVLSLLTVSTWSALINYTHINRRLRGRNANGSFYFFVCGIFYRELNHKANVSFKVEKITKFCTEDGDKPVSLWCLYC